MLFATSDDIVLVLELVKPLKKRKRYYGGQGLHQLKCLTLKIYKCKHRNKGHDFHDNANAQNNNAVDSALTDLVSTVNRKRKHDPVLCLTAQFFDNVYNICTNITINIDERETVKVI